MRSTLQPQRALDHLRHTVRCAIRSMESNRRPRHRDRSRPLRHGRVHGLGPANSALQQNKSHLRLWPKIAVSPVQSSSPVPSKPSNQIINSKIKKRPANRTYTAPSNTIQSNSPRRPPNNLPSPKTALPQPNPRRRRSNHLPPNRNLLRNHGLHHPLPTPFPRLLLHRFRSNGRRNCHRGLASRQWKRR